MMTASSSRVRVASTESRLRGPLVIVGLGKTGLSIARFLRRIGETFSVTDSRAEPPGIAELTSEMPEVVVRAGAYDEDLLAQAGCILLSPGVARSDLPAHAADAEVIGDIELFARYVDAPVLAITGANGKSTVTTLVGEMARHAGREARVGGNLGTPALDLLGDQAPDLYVLELSSFQLETVSTLDAAVATVLNITPDHMDRYASLDDYAEAKARIFRGTGTLVLNADDPMVMAMRIPNRRELRFALRLPADDAEFGIIGAGTDAWIAQGHRKLLAVGDLRIKGTHNVANALAALAIGQAAGLEEAAMLTALRTFAGLKHRCQWVGTRDGIDWFDDSKGTNVGATVAAIVGLGETRPVVLIAGGEGKGQDFSDLEAAARGRLRAAVIIGRDGPAIADALRDVVPVFFARDMRDAVERCAELARQGDAVLLSPACASFDMFRDYNHRGEVFAAAVMELLT